MNHIVALGGGGFSMEPRNLVLDQYILALAGRARPRVCFLGTASGDAQAYIDGFYRSFRTLRCRPAHQTLFKTPAGDIDSFLLAMDVIYVGGGNTRSMLAVWREWGVDRILRKAWRKGIVLAGISAGSLCWFEQGVTDSVSARLSPIKCLGFLSGSNCPHYDGERNRRPVYRRLIRQGLLKPGYAADDGVGLHFVGGTLSRVVSSRKAARAYRLEMSGGRLAENEIVPEYLK